MRRRAGQAGHDRGAVLFRWRTASGQEAGRDQVTAVKVSYEGLKAEALPRPGTRARPETFAAFTAGIRAGKFDI
jgi:hypothetical protein